MVRRQPCRRSLVDGCYGLRVAHASTVLTAADISHFRGSHRLPRTPSFCTYLKTRRGWTAVREDRQSTVER